MGVLLQTLRVVFVWDCVLQQPLGRLLGVPDGGRPEAKRIAHLRSVVLGGAAAVVVGPHAYKARATDAVGNVSEYSAEMTVVVDATAPTVTGVTPAATPKPPKSINATATFSEGMDEASVEAPGVFKTTRKGTSSPVPATVFYDPVTKTVTLDPASDLKRGATYTATLATGARDEAGNALAAPKAWTFTVR